MIAISTLTIIALTTCLAHLALLGYVGVKMNTNRRITVPLLGYLSMAFVWNLLILVQENNLLAPLWDGQWLMGFLYAEVVLALTVWLFANRFLNLNRVSGWDFGIAGAALALMAAVEFTPLPMESLSVNRLEVVFWIGVAAVVLFFIKSLWVTRRAQQAMYSPRHKNRAQFFSLVLIVLAVGVGLFTSLLPVYQSIGLLVHWLGGLGLVYITINQNLPDIKTAVKELLSALAVVLFSLVFYFFVVYWAQIQAQQLSFAIGLDAIGRIALLAAVLLTLLAPPLSRLVQHVTHRLLFSNQYNYKQIVSTYIQAINHVLFIENLVSISLLFIEQKLRIKHGAYFLLREEDENTLYFDILSGPVSNLPEKLALQKNTPFIKRLVDEETSTSQYALDIAPELQWPNNEDSHTLKSMGFEQYFPVMRNTDLIAILALGPFSSGMAYSLQDIELLSTIAAQTAIALENARLFEGVRYHLDEITQINEFMDNIFASIESGVITTDINNNITICNQAAYHLFDLPADLLPGQSIDVVLHHMRHTPLPALIRDVRNTQRSYQGFELTHETADNGTTSLSIDITSIKDPLGHTKGIAMVINDLTETQRLQVVQNLFRKYLSPAVVDRLPNDPRELKLGGHRQQVTILFADIRGFSTFSEHQNPEKLINVLNKYLSMAAESILAYEGTLDKFMGDAVMAIYNAPLAQEDHPLRAVKSAAAMQRAITEYHQMMGLPDSAQLSFGVGIHTGEAIVGNVGTQSRMDYTAIGDAVNLAKRIQENTPGGRILVSQSTYELVKDNINAIPHKELTVKGRETPEQTYELLKII